MFSVSFSRDALQTSSEYNISPDICADNDKKITQNNVKTNTKLFVFISLFFYDFINIFGDVINYLKYLLNRVNTNELNRQIRQFVTPPYILY
jgi:hypothetical protein